MANQIAIKAQAAFISSCEITLSFPDKTIKKFTYKEGDIIENLVYKSGKNLKKISGRIQVINFQSLDGSSPGITECIEKSKSVLGDYVKPISLIVDGSDDYVSRVENILIGDIKSIGDAEVVDAEVVEVSPADSLVTKIEEVKEGTVLELSAGTYDEPLNISKAVIIRAKEGEAVEFTQPVSITAESGKVEISGVTFSDIPSEGTGSGKKEAKGYAVDVKGGANVELSGNDFANLNNFYSIINVDCTGDVVIKNNEFTSGDCYNGIEWTYGSGNTGNVTITGNKFYKVCNHNVFNFYQYEEGAVITISDNWFEFADNMVRISNLNNASASFVFERNSYEATGDYTFKEGEASSLTCGGMVMLQDNTGNQDFSKISLKFVDNYFKPVGEEAVLVSADTFGTDAQAYVVYKDKAAEIVLPQVEFANTAVA